MSTWARAAESRAAVRTADNQAPVLALNTPRSYSLYISIPFCPSRCSYCSFVSRTTAESGSLIEPYVQALCRELAEISALARRNRLRLETVYIGGGTPTAVSAAQLRTLMQAVRDNFDVPAVREYTVEAGRPDCDKTNHIGFVASGIFRLTRIDTNGNEWIVGYSFENDFVCDYPSLINRTSATVSIKATTDCEVYLLPLSELNQFWETDMETQRLGRRIAETMFAEIYQRLLRFYCDTPEQRYQALMKRCCYHLYLAVALLLRDFIVVKLCHLLG